MARAELDGGLLALLRDLQTTSPVVTTIANGRPNRIAEVTPTGVWIETEASAAKGSGPQLVPAWMLEAAWGHLRSHGVLENAHLVSGAGLNVKRSSAVCALLARLPGVSVTSSRPIILAFAG